MVLDNDGKEIGRIVDVVVDPAGQPRAIVVDVGGFMGVGSRRVAVELAVGARAAAERGRPARSDRPHGRPGACGAGLHRPQQARRDRGAALLARPAGSRFRNDEVAGRCHGDRSSAGLDWLNFFVANVQTGSVRSSPPTSHPRPGRKGRSAWRSASARSRRCWCRCRRGRGGGRDPGQAAHGNTGRRRDRRGRADAGGLPGPPAGLAGGGAARGWRAACSAR